VNPEMLVLCPFGMDAGLVSKAAAMAGESGVRVLVPAGEEAAAAQMGAARIHALKTAEAVADESDFALWLAESVQNWGNRIILAPATVQMRNIMPMLAWHLKGGLTADCTALELEGADLIQTRPAFGNSLMASIRSMSEIQMATVRPGTFRPEERPCVDSVIAEELYTPKKQRIIQLSKADFAMGKPLSQAKIIVAGGLGVGSKENFAKLAELAQRLGAGLGASRSAVDAGFAPYRCQVGITGTTVCPKLYIAVGISGAVQHLSGMSGAEKVIAINSDPKAPIFDYADYGIVADWEDAVDQLMKLIKQEEPL